MGFLRQPHTSAGRVPTDKGYRFYVDCLRDSDMSEDKALKSLIARSIRSIREDSDRFLRDTTRVLSDASRSLVFALPMGPDGTTLNRLQLFRYRDKQIAAVVLTDEGVIKNKILRSNFGLSQKDLNRISDYLNSEFSGCTIGEIRSALLRQMSKEKAICDILINRVVDICREALTFPEDEMIVSGLAKLLALPEFSDRINEIVRAIEDKRKIVGLLDGISTTDGVSVVIGSENPLEDMQGLSIVVARYKRDDRPLGAVGLIGPTRMDYPRAISMVNMMANLISGRISRQAG
jgi:heat-inducible transcriptional repressor